MSMVGIEVQHSIHGSGLVTSEKPGKITVKFADAEMLFQYPQAFMKYLSCSDPEANSQIQLDIIAYKQAEEKRIQAEKEKIRSEVEKRWKKEDKAPIHASVGSYKSKKNDYYPDLVESIEEIKANCKCLDNYIQSRRDPEYSFALKLIKNGTCFLAIKNDGILRFYPSRFIGYYDNTMNRHENNCEKDGTVTTPQISSIIGKGNPKPNTELNKSYIEYCIKLGISYKDKGAFGVERKFWEL